MSDDNGIGRAIIKIDHPQIAVAEAIMTLPFACHGFDSRHGIRMLSQMLEFGL